MEAKLKRNATIISVDPRFTRSSSKADIMPDPLRNRYCFLGGMVNYAIQQGKINKRYIQAAQMLCIWCVLILRRVVPRVIRVDSQVGMARSILPPPGTMSTLPIINLTHCSL